MHNNVSPHKYSVLAGCNSGNVNLKVHSTQSCALDKFSLSIWEINIDGNDVGSHYWRPLTSGEISSIKTTGLNIESLNSNVNGGSNNGTITMVGGKLYGVEFRYTGQGTSQPTYLTIHYKQGSWDLVIGDALNLDIQSGGFEPVSKWNNNVFASPNLWNKLSTSSNPSNGIHENPDFVSNSTNDNRILIKVTNIGCSTSSSNVPVRLFWTRARTKELWSKNWLFDLANNKIISSQSPFADVAGGSEITIGGTYTTPYKSSISGNISPFLLPAISAGSTFTIGFNDGVKWFPPNPADFGPSNGSMSNDQTYPVICLLARINEPNSSNDKINWEPTGTSDEILQYVKNNNNVATRNTWLVNSPQHIKIKDGNGNTTGWHHGFATTLVNNPRYTNVTVNLCVDLLPLQNVEGDFLDFGEIEIGLTNSLYNNWVTGGSNSTNLSSLSPTLFTITNGNHACLNNIMLPPNSQEQIGLKFKFPIEGLPDSLLSYTYQLSQVILDSTFVNDSLAVDSVFGSNVVFFVDVPVLPDTINSYPGINSTSVNEMKIHKMSVYPNPTNDKIMVKLLLTHEGNSELIILNNEGKQIFKDEIFVKGEYLENIDVSNYPEGIYFIHLKSGESSEVKKFTVIHKD